MVLSGHDSGSISDRRNLMFNAVMIAYFITLRFFAKLPLLLFSRFLFRERKFPEKSVKKVFYLIKETLVLLAWVRLEGLFVPKGFDDFLLLF